MRLRIALSVVVASSLATGSVRAASNPVLTAVISGIELCPQEICGQAVFAGNAIASVNGKPAPGVFWTGITHTALPTTNGGKADITGGTWLIRTAGHTFAGAVQAVPNAITCTNPGCTLFTIMLPDSLLIGFGGSGAVTFDGTLSHAVFPPTIVGTVSQ
jgi:hypothetical protein